MVRGAELYRRGSSMEYQVGNSKYLRKVPLLTLLTVLIFGTHFTGAAAQQQAELALALCDSAYSYLAQGDPRTALTFARSAVEADDSSARTHTCLGRVFLAVSNRIHRALECFNQALFIDDEYHQALYWKAEGHLRLAPTDLGKQNAREAQNALNTLLELDPSHPNASYLLGLTNRDFLEDYPAAIIAFRRQVEAS